MDAETDVTVPLTGEFAKLRNLVGDKVITRQPQTPNDRKNGQRRRNREQHASFTVHLLPHSYAVFAAEK